MANAVQKAKVTSLEVLEDFRARLIVYVSKARPTLEEVSAEALRAKLWLENEQRTHLEAELKRRRKDLEEAQQALFSARIANLRQESTAEQFAFHRAKRAAGEAEDKLRVLKKWTRDFDGRVEPLVKQMEKLHTVLANDMVQAAAYLAEAIKILAAYADIKPPEGAPSPPTPAVQVDSQDGESS
jgi:hypothetical protein